MERFKDSTFPCDRVMYFLSSCTDFYVDRTSLQFFPKIAGEVQNTPADIANEPQCLCSPTSEAQGEEEGEFFDLIKACTTCQSLHGYGEESRDIFEQRRFGKWIKNRFCNSTVPEGNYYEITTKETAPLEKKPGRERAKLCGKSTRHYGER